MNKTDLKIYNLFLFILFFVACGVSGGDRGDDFDLTGNISGQDIGVNFQDEDTYFSVLDSNNNQSYDEDDQYLYFNLNEVSIDDDQTLSGWAKLITYYDLEDGKQYAYTGSSSVSGKIIVNRNGVSSTYNIESILLQIQTVDFTYGSANITGNFIFTLENNEGEIIIYISSDILFVHIEYF